MESDADVLQRWVDGDAAAGNELLGRHFSSVRRFFASKLSRGDVEDLVQRTFTGVVQSASGFRGESSFRTFLFSVARNQLHAFLRDRARRKSRDEPDFGVSSVVSLGQSPSSVVAAKERESLLMEALRRIPLEQQTLLELSYWEGLSAPEIAGVLEIQPGAVRVRLHRARQALLEQYKNLRGPADIDLDATARSLGKAV